MSFSCFPHKGIYIESKDHVKCVPLENAPQLIEGANEIKTLCPVNKLSGKRCNPISLLDMVAGGKVNERVLAQVLQELPSVPQDSNMSDAMRFQFVESRLCTGTPAEDALMSERLWSCASELGIDTSNLSRDSSGRVVFERTGEEKANVNDEVE